MNGRPSQGLPLNRDGHLRLAGRSEDVTEHTGYRVLELCSVLSGPWAGRLLCDLGMDVVKVEPPEGDIARRMGPWRNDVSSLFLSVNYGKRSVCVDLKSPDGREVLLRLVDQADVLLENWRPGVADRLGLSPDSLRARNRRLVTASLTGFGTDGPRASGRAYDPIIQGVTGTASLQGLPGTTPRLVRTHLTDKLGSLAVTQGILAALLERERTGRGTHVEASLYAATLAFLWPDMLRAFAFAGGERTDADLLPQPAPASLFPVRDGKWIVISVLSEKEWRGLCQAVNRSDWIDQFSSIDDRRRHWSEIESDLADIFEQMASDDVLALLAEHGVASGPVVSPAAAITDPQAAASGVVAEGHLPGLEERFRWPGGFVTIGGRGRAEPGQPAPRLGADTVDLLGEAGFSDAEISRLRADGVVITL